MNRSSTFFPYIEIGEIVQEKVTGGRRGTVIKIWHKETVVKKQDRTIVSVSYEYSIRPEVNSHNVFRAKEEELCMVLFDEKLNETIAEPEEVYKQFPRN